MPPRFAYWTILIDKAPTAFRARDAQDLLPTLHQLKRKNADVVLRWFSGGRLWDSPEAAQEARRRRPAAADKRMADWRRGGAYRDQPRQGSGAGKRRFMKNPRRQPGRAPRKKDDEPPDRH